MSTHTTDDGCRIAYEVAGPAAAPPLVLSHSLGNNRGLWDAQIDALSRSFRVLRYDTRGHGASDAPPGDYSLERLGRDVLSLMDRAGMASAHVCGVSIGGITTLWLGIHAPDRVRRLVLANTGARLGSLAMWDERMQQVKAGGVASLADATMGRCFTAAFRAAHPEIVARIRATFVSTSATGYLGCCAALRDADLRADAARVRAPSLVITGAHDPSTPPALGERIAAAIPGATLVQLESAHLSNVECAAAFTEAIVQFLSS